METHHRSVVLRILAPAALIVFGIALAMIISSANSSSDSGATSTSAAEKQRDLGSSTTKSSRTHTTRDKLPQRVYVVKSGDTLGSISEKVGVSVEKLQQLNPNLDQFSLVAGQKIKIREWRCARRSSSWPCSASCPARLRSHGRPRSARPRQS